MMNEDSSGSKSFCFQMPTAARDCLVSGPLACMLQGPDHIHRDILLCGQLVRGAREAQSFECPVFYFYKVSLWQFYCPSQKIF